MERETQVGDGAEVFSAGGAGNCCTTVVKTAYCAVGPLGLLVPVLRWNCGYDWAECNLLLLMSGCKEKQSDGKRARSLLKQRLD